MASKMHSIALAALVLIACRTTYAGNPVQDIGGACTADADCDTANNLKCSGTTQGSVCECTAMYKNVNNACVMKVLDDTCTADGDCSGKTYAVCTSGMCKCDGNHTAKDGNCTVGLDNPCTADVNCNKVMYAVCTNSMCKCDATHTTKMGACVTAYGNPCTAAADCAGMTGSNIVCTDNKCACADKFKQSGFMCVAENGATVLSMSTLLFLAVTTVALLFN